jgi:hypothetical protein
MLGCRCGHSKFPLVIPSEAEGSHGLSFEVTPWDPSASLGVTAAQALIFLMLTLLILLLIDFRL